MIKATRNRCQGVDDQSVEFHVGALTWPESFIAPSHQVVVEVQNSVQHPLVLSILDSSHLLYTFKMKRERNSPTPSPPLLTPPSSSPLTTPKSNKKQKRQAPTQSSPSAKQDLEAKISGGWTPENKSKLVALIFEAGLASIKLDEVALLVSHQDQPQMYA